MKTIIERAYRVLVVVSIALCLFAVLAFRLEIRTTKTFENTSMIDNAAHMERNNANSVTGKSNVYSFNLRTVQQDYNKLYVYTVNQSVNIYVANQLVYHVGPTGEGLNSKTTGRIWSKWELSPKDSGQLVQIECIPCFENTDGVEPIIFFGEEYDIKYQIVLRDLVVVALGTLVLFGGFIILVTELVLKHRGGGKDAMLYAGIFSILTGFWKVVQCPVIALLTIQIPALATISFLCLMLLGIPFILSVKASLEDEGILWYIPIWVAMGNILFCLTTYIIGILDLKETAPLTAVSLLFIIIVIYWKVFHVWKKDGMSDKVRRVLVECSACTFWYFCDVLIYFTSRGARTSSISIVGIGVYLFTVVKSSLENSSALMKVGMHAKQYAKLAFKDALTGFNNRAAYADHLDNKQYAKESTTAIVCDLNNLKKCNDTYGHAKGDYYIKESAKIIEKCFGDLGTCYRLGGDEFTVLVPQTDLELIEARCALLMMMVQSFNDASEDIKMGIAHGYACYKEGVDNHFEDIIKRADQMMYQNKALIKKQAEAEG